MFIILGFYKFKNLKSLKRHKTILENLFSENDIRGTLIISKEGLNGTLSGKSKNISKISKIIKSLFKIKKFDSENLSKSKLQPFHKQKIKIKKEVVPMGININSNDKKNKVLLQKLFIQNKIRGTLIISKEGLNGSISGKSKSISLISKKIKILFRIRSFDSENLSKSEFQPFQAIICTNRLIFLLVL